MGFYINSSHKFSTSMAQTLLELRIALMEGEGTHSCSSSVFSRVTTASQGSQELIIFSRGAWRGDHLGMDLLGTSEFAWEVPES